MKKTIYLIITLLLISFSLSSAPRRGDHEIPLSCVIDYIYENISDKISINENDFSSHEAGTLSDTDSHIIIITINDCSKSYGEVRLKIENSSIDNNTGYLKNQITDDSASANIAFQLLYNEEQRPLDLNKENEFVEDLIDGEVEFYFFANYVKKDDISPKPGYIQSNIQFTIKINDDVVTFDDS
ncbi:fimbrial protein [Proteus terrae]|uniref:fimbrial protein n=2 Tax=Proteus terrae TaxID=1574161 RepID=UPI0018C54FF6|nr:type 1 fimbrial protein [Proteus terrae]MBG2836081.1 type 1 fimbrial protein [Proteus terrae subsp. cibarius]MBG2867275.1 type 1 fimbrial protein [Proteus terrae subsp. cibarius]